jgi:hypothetical protein
MKTTHPFNTFKTLILTTAIGCATLGSLAAHAGNIIWTNSISGGWDTAANWNPNSVPGAGDTAIITNAGVAVSLNSGTTAGAVILGTSGGGTAFLSLNNQTLALNGPLTVNSGGAFTVDSGALVGNTNAVLSGTIGWSAGSLGGILTLAAGSTLYLISANNHNLPNLTLTNNGTVVWTTGPVQGGGGSGTYIYNNGVWNALDDSTWNNAYGYNGTVFNNYGTFRKSGGGDEFDTATYFANGVVFNQLAGVMDVQNGVNGLNLVLAGSGSFTGGYVTTNVAGFTYLSSGNFTINGTVTTTNVWEAGGNLVGANIINGGLNWQAGNWNNAVAVTIATNSTLMVAGGAGNNDLQNAVVTNNGTVVWASGTLEGGGGSGTAIYNNGRWLASSDQTFNDNFGYAGTVFNNYGTFSKTGGAGEFGNFTYFASGVVFNQLAGVLDVQSGVNGLNLVLAGSGSFTGGYITSKTGGLTYLYSGNFTINGTVTPTNLIENAGNLVGANVINGALTWQGGVWNGAASVTIATNSTLIVAGGAGNNDMGNTVVTNNGTVLWASGTIRGGGGNLNPGTTIVNNGSWNAQSDQTINNYFAYYGTVFNNYGTFSKTGGAGAFANATVFAGGVVFNQLAGVIDVKSGVNGLSLVLQGNGNFTGGYIATNAAGLTYLSGGSFTINGTVTPTNVIENAGNLVGANVINGALTWQAGVWNGAASVTIATNSTLIVSGGAGVNDMANTVVTNNGTVLWASGTIRGGGGNLNPNPGTTIVNNGWWNAQSDQTINDNFGYNGTVFNNYGTFSKTGGASANQTLFTAGVLFNQLAGVLDVQSGGNGLNLVLQGNGNFTGGYVTSKTGGLTYLSSGNFTLNGAVTSTNLIENAGNLAGSNVIHGALTWQAGVWNGAASVTIATNSTLILAGGGFGYNDMANTVVINNGTVLWTSGTIRGGGGNHSPGTLIVNNGLWLVPSSMVINNYYGYNNTIFDNFGTFRKIGISNGVTEIDVEFDTGGLLDVQTGIVWFHGPVTYQGIVNFGISSGATYGQIWDDNPVAIQGALSVNLINGYASLAGYGLGTNNVNGDIPALITWPADSTYYTITGFGNPPLTNMPAGETWSARYSNTGIYLLLASINPQLTGVNLVGTNLVLSGAGGSAGSNYVVLASTNLTLPLANWTMLTTNAFDVNGLFNFTNPVNSGKPKEFFTFKVP